MTVVRKRTGSLPPTCLTRAASLLRMMMLSRPQLLLARGARSFSSKPSAKPASPNFSSGPCKKRPGYSLANLNTSGASPHPVALNALAHTCGVGADAPLQPGQESERGARRVRGVCVAVLDVSDTWWDDTQCLAVRTAPSLGRPGSRKPSRTPSASSGYQTTTTSASCRRRCAFARPRNYQCIVSCYVVRVVMLCAT